MDSDEPHDPSGDSEPLADDSAPRFVMRRAAPPSRTPEQQLRKVAVFQELFPNDEPPAKPSFGRYHLHRKLGQGGSGTVFEAHDPHLDRRIALKLLLPEQTSGNTPARFRREGKALARVSHPNVVQVHDAGEIDGRPFVAMELIDGRPLNEWQRQTPPPGWRRCVEVYLEAGRGLAAVHAAGLVHRDFKPQNCMLDARGRTRVLDFGLVTQRTDAALPIAPAKPTRPDDDLVTPLTKTGTTLGTVAYMSLEQLHREPADEQSDQFSFCVSLYEAVYGHRPFDGATDNALMLAMEDGSLTPTRPRPGVPKRLRRALLRGLRAEPGERWPSMDALLAELENIVAPRLAPRTKVALGAFGVGIVLANGTPSPPPCAGSAEQMDAVWDEARRAEVRQAFETSDHPNAARTWTLVEPRLDAFAQEWIARHTETCEATLVHEVQPEEDMAQRMRCLSSGRLALRETVGALARPTASAIDNAITLLSDLPRLARCEDIEALRMDVPLPEDPQRARTAEDLRARLVRVHARTLAGDFAEAETELDDIVAQAESDALAYPPVLAEALWQRGELHDELGRHEPARRDLERAYLLAVEHDHRDVEAKAASSLTWVIGRQQARYADGYEWGTRALALAKRRGMAPEIEAGVLGNLGTMLVAQGELAEAGTMLQRALALEESIVGPEDPSIPNTLDELGHVMFAEQQGERALEHYRDALAKRRAILGDGHPDVAKSLGNIGNVLGAQGRLDEARSHFEQALALQRVALRPEHVDLARTLGNIGHVLQAKGDDRRALEHHRQALAIWRHHGPQSLELALTLGNIALALQSTGDLDGALTHYDRALDIMNAKAPLGLMTAQTLDNIAFVLIDEGRFDEALDRQQRALGIYQHVLGDDHPSVASVLANMGRALLLRGNLDRARESVLRSLEIYERRRDPEHADLAYPRLLLAEIAEANGDHAAARQTARRVLARCPEDSACAHLRAEARGLVDDDAPPEMLASAPD